MEINICGNTFERAFHNKGLSDLGVDLMQESVVRFMPLKWPHDIRLMTRREYCSFLILSPGSELSCQRGEGIMSSFVIFYHLLAQDSSNSGSSALLWPISETEHILLDGCIASFLPPWLFHSCACCESTGEDLMVS